MRSAGASLQLGRGLVLTNILACLHSSTRQRSSSRPYAHVFFRPTLSLTPMTWRLPLAAPPYVCISVTPPHPATTDARLQHNVTSSVMFCLVTASEYVDCAATPFSESSARTQKCIHHPGVKFRVGGLCGNEPLVPRQPFRRCNPMAASKAKLACCVCCASLPQHEPAGKARAVSIRLYFGSRGDIVYSLHTLQLTSRGSTSGVTLGVVLL